MQKLLVLWTALIDVFKILHYLVQTGISTSIVALAYVTKLVHLTLMDILCEFFGPFLFGSWPDRRIFKEKIANILLEIEKVIADDGRKTARCVTPFDISSTKKVLHSKLRACHETCNARMKLFSILDICFRNGVKTYKNVFHAISRIVWLMTDYKQPLFDIKIKIKTLRFQAF